MAAEFGHLNLPQPERAHTASKNSRDRQRSGFGKITQQNSRISSCQGRPAERADFGSLGGPAERRFAPSTAGKRYSATPNREAAERALTSPTPSPICRLDIKSWADAHTNLPSGQGGFAQADVALRSNKAEGVGPQFTEGLMQFMSSVSIADMFSRRGSRRAW